MKVAAATLGVLCGGLFACGRDAPPRPRGAPAPTDPAAIFGARVNGFVEVTDAAGTTYVALGAEEGTPPLARKTAEATTTYATWDALVTAHPAAGETAALGSLAAAANEYVARHTTPSYTTPGSYAVITDPNAYRETYRRENHGTFLLRYQAGTAFNETAFIVDWDRIAAPSVRDGVLTAFFAEGRHHQPVRGTFDLHHATLEAGMPLEPAFTSELVRGELDPVSPDELIDDARRAR